ncbi:pyruvate decarboxylase PdcB [Cokeromyces recurvatus]|uniref:pyruvate decarboxylase PdcB n=1 Tax=Cokeromyces recurvatus TaxID=90255 RepID=UPI00221F67B5|nr:pyruvate decarboxylase PdcB [Cokeromyces recurvatus]KAI7902851.1 pyruvate decarboxylase PdcB [Cokeromyces recurvatus]
MPLISIGHYLLKRLKELNIDTIFGVPGDYNMPLLDLIEDDKELTWGNNVNELNAAYAADGYARIRGMGAVVTTFGVGELSAINGIAGSYSEMLPVIHIVGTPITSSQVNHAILHHTLGNGDFQVFTKIASHLTVASTHLTQERAIEEINRVIQTSYLHKRPGYIAFPLDLMTKQVEISDTALDTPLDLKLPPNPEDVQEIVLKKILKLIEHAKRPIIIVDGCVLRQRLQSQVNDFVRRSGFPTFTAPMGKGAIDEGRVYNFRGCYSGNVSLKAVIKEVEASDLLIELGSIKSDFNTGNFSYSGLERKRTISLHSFGTIIHYAEYPGVGMAELLPHLTANLPKIPMQLDLKERARPPPITAEDNKKEITHHYLWNKVPEYIPANSIIVTDTGTAEFGVFNMESPQDTIFISQILWGSIGFSVGAALGAAMADRQRRLFLFVGDGSFQLTCQEIAVFMRHGLTPTILLLNNDGYLIEKMIHGRHRDYNNYPMWSYDKTLDYFGGGRAEHNEKSGKGFPSKIGLQVQVKDQKEFEQVMTKVNEDPDKIHFIEVVMPQFDAPRELALLVENSENR